MSIDDVWNKRISILSDGIVKRNRQRYSTQQLNPKQIMDLKSAQKEAQEKSRKEKNKKFFLNVDDDGEVSISSEFVKDSSGFCYKNGSEIALPDDSKSPEPKIKGQKRTEVENTQTKETMKTKTAKSAKASKKVAAKKNGKTATKFPTKVGTNKTLTVTEITKLLKKGDVSIFRQSLPDVRGVITLKRAEAIKMKDGKIAVIICKRK